MPVDAETFERGEATFQLAGVTTHGSRPDRAAAFTVVPSAPVGVASRLSPVRVWFP